MKCPTKDIRKLQHSLRALLNDADQLSPDLMLSKYSVLMGRYEDYYRNRYPDNRVALTGMSSAQILELDEFIIFINEHLPCPFDAKYRTVLYALATFSLHGRNETPWERWIKHDNYALALLWPRIEADFWAVLANLHPDTPAR